METIDALQIDFKKGDGLVPVIVQNRETKEVLMLAYANAEAVSRTGTTGFAHYWSRSRQSIWKKGETSGHVQRVQQILIDCDEDALVYLVDQTGPACHTGARSCFFRQVGHELGTQIP